MHLLAAAGFLDAARPERVIVLGRPTLFRQVQRLLGDPRVTVDVIAHPRGYADPSGTARTVAAGWPDLRESARSGVGGGAGGRPIRLAASAVRAVLDELDIGASPRLARDLVAALPERATLVLGSSQAPRDVALSDGGAGRPAGGREPGGRRHRRHAFPPPSGWRWPPVPTTGRPSR